VKSKIIFVIGSTDMIGPEAVAEYPLKIQARRYCDLYHEALDNTALAGSF
jgi:hypothetical protein